MKKDVRLGLLSLAAGALLAACSGGGGGSDVPSSGVLGDVPSMIAGYEQKMNELKQSMTDEASAKQAMEEYSNLEAEKETQLKEAAEALTGKQVPTEVADAPVKILTPFTIKEFEPDRNRFMLEAEIELTGECTNLPGSDAFLLSSFSIVACGSDGQPFYSRNANYSDDVENSESVPAGTKALLTTWLDIKDWNAAAMGEMSKIVVCKEDGETFKKAETQSEALRANFGSGSK